MFIEKNDSDIGIQLLNDNACNKSDRPIEIDFDEFLKMIGPNDNVSSSTPDDRTNAINETISGLQFNPYA